VYFVTKLSVCLCAFFVRLQLTLMTEICLLNPAVLSMGHSPGFPITLGWKGCAGRKVTWIEDYRFIQAELSKHDKQDISGELFRYCQETQQTESAYGTVEHKSFPERRPTKKLPLLLLLATS
jgi:hypothetical protein